MEIYWFLFQFYFPVNLQSQDDSQLSNTGSQAKQKRKLAKPRKVRKRKGTDQGQNTITLKEVGLVYVVQPVYRNRNIITFVEKLLEWKGEGSYADAGCCEIFTKCE